MTWVLRRVAWLPVTGALLAAGLILGFWYTRGYLPFVPQYTSISERPYESLADLAEASDVVVRGTVNGVAGRQVDYGTQDAAKIAEGGGSPAVFYDVTVTEHLMGSTAKSIVVIGTDFGLINVASDHESPLRRGDELILFLKEFTTSDKPGITLYDLFYVPVGMDNGVFDLKNGDRVVPRLPGVFAEDEFTLSEAREQVRN